MKKITTLVMSMTAVFALTACGKGSKVSEEQFKEKANAVEAHQYSSATVKYSYSSVTKTEGEDDKKDEGNGTIEFTFSDGKWSTTSSDKYASEVKYYVGANVKDLLAAQDLSAALSGDAEGVESKMTYYTNPLGIEYSTKGSYESDSFKMSIDEKGYYAFDKYGFLTKVESSGTNSEEMNVSALGVTVASKATVTSKENITISYK